MITLRFDVCPYLNHVIHFRSSIPIDNHHTQQQLRSLNPNQTFHLQKNQVPNCGAAPVPALAVSSPHIMSAVGGEAKVVWVRVLPCLPTPNIEPRSTLKLETVAAPTRHYLGEMMATYVPPTRWD